MAGSSLLALIDDIATTLDDIAILTKVAAKKTSGVLGDDLALNAQQVAGVNADRELPVVFAVAKGSAINKIILVPAALVISQVASFLIVPLLMLGGSFLCFEGFEKIHEKLFHKKSKEKPDQMNLENEQNSSHGHNQDLATLEKNKIKGAIRTDFILSAEIVVITLGTVANENLLKQSLVLTGIATLMTVGVYGLVALIVKLDDMGLYLLKTTARWKQKLGNGLLSFAPLLMKFLGIAGTVAMFMVGGGIITHNVHALHELTSQQSLFVSSGLDIGLGIITGFLVFLGLKIVKKLFSK